MITNDKFELLMRELGAGYRAVIIVEGGSDLPYAEWELRVVALGNESPQELIRLAACRAGVLDMLPTGD